MQCTGAGDRSVLTWTITRASPVIANVRRRPTSAGRRPLDRDPEPIILAVVVAGRLGTRFRISLPGRKTNSKFGVEVTEGRMATEYTLRRADGQPFGSFEQVQARIRDLFPSVAFRRTLSGPEKLALAAERGITFPPALMAVLPDLPSLVEGVAEGDGFHVTFGLGHEEPVPCIYVTPRGSAPELERGLRALESDAGAEFKVSGEE